MTKDEMITKYTDQANAQKGLIDSLKANIKKVEGVIRATGKPPLPNDINVDRNKRYKVQYDLAVALNVAYNDVVTDINDLK